MFHRMPSPDVTWHCSSSPEVALLLMIRRPPRSSLLPYSAPVRSRPSSREVVYHCIPSRKAAEHRIGSPDIAIHRPSSPEVAWHRPSPPKHTSHHPTPPQIA